MRHLSIRSVIAAAGATLALVALAACGSDEQDEPTPAPTSEAPAEEEPPAAVAEGQASWANPVTTPGEKITSFKVGDLNVDVYQVGVEKATKTGNFVDPKDNQPIIAEGDDIVFVNYVVTNTGDPIDLGSSFLNVDARYDNWPFAQGMDSITDLALYEKLELHSSALKPGELQDPPVYTLGANESFSFAENFRYEKGTKIVFRGTATPVDDAGKLVHDNRAEGEGTATIK